MKVELPEKMAETLFKPSRYKVFVGGRGAGKTQNIARGLLIQGYSQRHKIICTREIQDSLKKSSYAVLMQEIEALGLSGFYYATKESIVAKNGTEFLFAGLRSNIDSIKSIPGLTRGWVEEAQSASVEHIRKLQYTIREPDSELWLSFNPDLEDDAIYQQFVVSPPEDAIVVHLNWRDNPWFPDVLRKDMEETRRRSEAEYLNIWEGQCRQAVDGAIFADEIRRASEERRITRVPIASGIPIQTFWDLGQSDNTAIWFVQIIGFEFRLVDYYQNSGQKMGHYVKQLADRKYLYGNHCLPQDADHEQLSAQSTIRQQLQTAVTNNPALGQSVLIVPRIPKKALGIDAARNIFEQCLFDKEKTVDGLQCLRHYAFAKDPETGKVSKEPKHDDWSHGTDAFLCFAQHFKRPQVKQPERSFVSTGSFWE